MTTPACIKHPDRKAVKIKVDGVFTLCRACFDARPRVAAPPGTTEEVSVRVPIGDGDKVRTYAERLRRRAGLTGGRG